MNKVYYSFLFSLCLIVFFAACKGSDESKEKTTPESTQEVVEKKAVADLVKMIPIALNNGEKWKADEMTTRGIDDLKAALQEIDVTASEEDHQVYVENVQRTLKQAFRSSGLEGKAKEQLEKYLNNVDQVAGHLSSSDTFVRQDAYEEMNKLLDTYNDYFE